MTSGIRELLSDYLETSQIVALWLRGYHVEGIITHVGEHFVTLTKTAISNVRVENNGDDAVVDTPNRIYIKLGAIKSISDGDST